MKGKQRNKLLSVVLVLIIPVAVVIRARLIYSEGPKVVKLLEEYKARTHTYPNTRNLKEVDIRPNYSPMYLYDKKNDEFILEYSLFVFYRRYYSSRRDQWGYMD